MPRRSFRYDPISKEMVEVTPTDDLPVHIMVAGDIPAFVSPLDGTVVEGRRAYYEHMKRHNVVPFEAGDEKRRPPPADPTPRREAIWEAVDRSMQRQKRR
jgi:hypothetical protein